MYRRILLVIFISLSVPIQAAENSRNTHERLNAVLWMQTSAEYRVLSEQLYESAWKSIEKKLADLNLGYGIPSAAIEQKGFNTENLPLAVVLDIDETVLDNSPMSGRLILNKAGYSSQNWDKWVEKENADFIPGALEFINKVHSANLKVIFVTNRTKREEAHTISDLKPLNFTDELILTSEESNPLTGEKWTGEKSPRREYLAKKYWIVALVGDDLGDFIPKIRNLPYEQRSIEASKYQEKFGDQWFLLPNPIYGSWESVLYNKTDDDIKQLEDKSKFIKSFEP